MFTLIIEHIDECKPGGSCRCYDLATFDNEVDCEAMADRLAGLFPDKLFSWHESDVKPHNPSRVNQLSAYALDVTPDDFERVYKE